MKLGSKFTIYDLESAPAESRPDLEAAKKKYGFELNLFGVLAESPTALRAYAAINEALESAALSPVEQQVVTLTVSGENGCTYCMGAHSAVAGMVNMPNEVLTALRERRALPDPKLDALRSFALAMVKQRGWVPDPDVQAFLDAGYSRRHLLDVVTIIALKTLSNYTNHLAGTPLDDAFAPMSWAPPQD
ncbi:MAG: carboxymuconolactone decarboxylase family protein [Acidobacteriota bacterium]|nr:carboxymuconolactone decarboxylase family protein [Acidobacteriota bacterium]